MIFKNLLLVFAFSLLSLSLFCQNDIKKGNLYYDVDSFPVFQIDSLYNEQTVSYYTTTEKKVSKEIKFRGGYESLSSFCDSLYYNRKDYNHDELNARALYTILFDKNLKICEVRILKRLAYNNLKYNYDDLVKRILFSTEGKWIKTCNNDFEWYFYLGFFNLR